MHRPLRKMTSTAYCRCVRLDLRGVRRGLPPLTLTATLLISGGCPKTTSRTARPVEKGDIYRGHSSFSRSVQSHVLVVAVPIPNGDTCGCGVVTMEV